MGTPPAILPHDRREWLCRLFRWYSRRLVRKNFNALRLARGGDRAFADLDAHEGPTVLLLNHQSWWDPILTTVLVDRFTPRRRVFAPMDLKMVQQFAFMRKLGLFGVDQGDPSAFRAMVQYATHLAATNEHASFWITPQGGFSDVRAPLELRPGAAAIASRLDAQGRPPKVLCLAIELNFWEDRKPEVLLLAKPCPVPHRSTTSTWQRQMTDTLDAAMQDLARLAIARDPTPFQIVLGKGASGINPIYDGVLRLTGRQPNITTPRRTEAAP